jgi:hypothetical protein
MEDGTQASLEQAGVESRIQSMQIGISVPDPHPTRGFDLTAYITDFFVFGPWRKGVADNYLEVLSVERNVGPGSRRRLKLVQMTTQMPLGYNSSVCSTTKQPPGTPRLKIEMASWKCLVPLLGEG